MTPSWGARWRSRWCGPSALGDPTGPQALPARGPGHRALQPPPHRDDLRRGGARGLPLRGAGVPRGPDPAASAWREQRPAVKEALRLGLAIAEALEEAHAHKVLHRDLKPQNVFFPRTAELRVLDFGLAKLVAEARRASGGPASADPRRPTGWSRRAADRDRGASRRADGRRQARQRRPQAPYSLLERGGRGARAWRHGLRGTPAYMAPEQWPDEPVTPADRRLGAGGDPLRAAGRSRPYPTPRSSGLAFVVGDERAGAVAGRGRAGAAPARLVELVDRCLDKDAERRPSAEAVVASCSADRRGHAARSAARATTRHALPRAAALHRAPRGSLLRPGRRDRRLPGAPARGDRCCPWWAPRARARAPSSRPG